MTPHAFITKWGRSTLSERSACQQHFCDLCDMLGQPKPADTDPDGTHYTFERGVRKTDGEQGWADVWMKDRFGWEYKGKHKDLAAAYKQLLLYREDLDNPPLLVVCDMDRFEVHTNFTGTAKKVYAFALDGLAEPHNLDVLRKLFTDPASLKPGQTTEAITRQAAELFGQISDAMRVRGIEALQAAHFLMKLMFCMFAEDIELLPGKLFTKIVAGAKKHPEQLGEVLRNLFSAMSKGGYFGADEILFFNGGLFADADVLPLKPAEIDTLVTVNQFDWSQVEPSVFGTLFERTLDPSKRSQIGAHYTSREDIETLLQPVMMQPLRREWADVQARCEALGEDAAQAKTAQTKKNKLKQRDQTLRDFVERLAHVQVLDAACGSGNFLYVAIHLLLDLEKEVIAYAARHGLGLFPHVRPTQLSGIEINPYAQQLAQVVIWIGYLQWMHENGFNPPRDPVLEPIESIRQMDAILDLSDPQHPTEPEWPEAEFIVGNPPFLGNRLMSAHFDREYISGLSKVYEQRLGGRPDICCYWFEKARDLIARKRTRRAGLLATQGIRGGTNRNVLKRIKQSGGIFFAESDRDWVLDGANVHVSMVGFDDGSDLDRILDGKRRSDINANLTGGVDITKARKLLDNKDIGFQGAIKRGSFDFPESIAIEILNSRGNPHGRPNSDVLLPYTNGMDVTRRIRWTWIVDFGDRTPEVKAANYTAPFEYVKAHVLPERMRANQKKARDEWWLHWCPRPELNAALSKVKRYIATPRVSKYRVFVWLEAPSYPDCQLILFARDDDYAFGVLHSRLHAVWSLVQGTQVRERESGFRYTPTTCFETFPFPEPTDAQRSAIAEAAKELDRLRNNWLNPPEWTREEILEFPGSAGGPWARYLVPGSSPAASSSRAAGIGTVRYPRTVARDEECAKQLKKRTLTNLYNERPTWLDLAHRRLDEAVFAAYGWDAGMTDDEILAALLELNLARAADEAAK